MTFSLFYSLQKYAPQQSFNRQKSLASRKKTVLLKPYNLLLEIFFTQGDPQRGTYGKDFLIEDVLRIVYHRRFTIT